MPLRKEGFYRATHILCKTCSQGLIYVHVLACKGITHHCLSMHHLYSLHTPSIFLCCVKFLVANIKTYAAGCCKKYTIIYIYSDLLIKHQVMSLINYNQYKWHHLVSVRHNNITTGTQLHFLNNKGLVFIMIWLGQNGVSLRYAETAGILKSFQRLHAFC